MSSNRANNIKLAKQLLTDLSTPKKESKDQVDIAKNDLAALHYLKTVKPVIIQNALGILTAPNPEAPNSKPDVRTCALLLSVVDLRAQTDAFFVLSEKYSKGIIEQIRTLLKTYQELSRFLDKDPSLLQQKEEKHSAVPEPAKLKPELQNHQNANLSLFSYGLIAKKYYPQKNNTVGDLAFQFAMKKILEKLNISI